MAENTRHDALAQGLLLVVGLIGFLPITGLIQMYYVSRTEGCAHILAWTGSVLWILLLFGLIIAAARGDI